MKVVIVSESMRCVLRHAATLATQSQIRHILVANTAFQSGLQAANARWRPACEIDADGKWNAVDGGGSDSGWRSAVRPLGAMEDSALPPLTLT